MTSFIPCKPGYKPPKHAKTIAEIERLNIYLADNPTCNLEKAAKIMGISGSKIRKWKQFGWIKHLGARDIKKMLEEKAGKDGKPKRKPGRPRKHNKDAELPEELKETSSGVVAAPVESSASKPMENHTLEQLLELGKNLKVSELRAIIKQHILMQITDAKAVASYATALKQMAGVQDIELEDVYESSQMIRIYCPKEHDVKELSVLEVDKIEL